MCSTQKQSIFSCEQNGDPCIEEQKIVTDSLTERHTLELSSKVPRTVSVKSDLLLELVNESHANELFSLTDRNRAFLRKWLPWLDCTTSKCDTLSFILSRKRALASNIGLSFAILYKERIAGVISFNEIHWAEKGADIGYWIGEEFQGLGLITCCVPKLIEIGFQNLYLNSVSISCATQNFKSQKIPLRLGFKEVKIIPKRENLYGTFVDHIVYTILKN